MKLGWNSVIVVALGATLCGTMLHAQTIVLRTAAQEGSAPKFIESDGAPTGHCPDILRAIERLDKSLRFEIDPRPTPIKRLENELKEGRMDVICALLDTPVRNEIAYRVSTPVYSVKERLVGRIGDDILIDSVQDLAQSGSRVVTQSGASYAAVLRAAGVTVDETTGGSSVALRNVAIQRVRFFYTNELTGAYYIREEGLGDKLRLHPGVLQSSPSYMWVSREAGDEVVQKLERALATLQRRGELDRIYRRYQQSR